MMIALSACGTTPKRQGTEASLRIWTEPRPGQKEHLIRETWMEPDYQTMPLEDLKREIRAAEDTAKTDGDWQRASDLRHILEMRQLNPMGE